MRYRILVLGGYGTFGTRICRALAQDKLVRVIIAGRRIEAAQQLATKLEQALPGCRAEVAAVDIGSPEFSAKLRQLRPDAVIHTCGPFQDQDYAVARACIANAVHYIDLADSRSFVTGISALHEDAQRQGVLAVSGASSVPALSAAVVDALQTRFRQLHSIDLGISPGNRTARGLATVRSILSYCGKPFPVWRDNRWQTVHGWQGLHRRHYPAAMGERWLGHCDVPDPVYPATDIDPFRAPPPGQCTNSRRFRRGAVRREWSRPFQGPQRRNGLVGALPTGGPGSAHPLRYASWKGNGHSLRGKPCG